MACVAAQAALYFASYQQQRQTPARADASALKAGAAHLAADADVVRALVAEVATVLDSAKFGEALAVRACPISERQALALPRLRVFSAGYPASDWE